MDGPSLDDLVAQIRRTAGADPLDRVDAAIARAATLAGYADALVDRFVAEARQAGLSWTDIGAHLGVTKQAARKRFTDQPPTPVLGDHVQLRPRLTACLDRAHELARTDRSGEVSTHHLLAGLLADGVAAAILEHLGVTADAVLASGTRLFGPPPPLPDDGQPPLSAEAIFAVEAAAHHAQAAAPDPTHVEVDTQHLLLVLALDPGGRARRVLVDLGTDIAAIKQELACHLPVNPRRIGRPRRRRRTSSSCSFCGAAETPNQPLVHGPAVTICATCTARAAQIHHLRTS